MVGEIFDSELGMVLFFSIFQGAGGVALGLTLRQLIRARLRNIGCQPLFFLVWGAMFAFIPLGIGMEEGGSLLMWQVIVLGTVIIISFTGYDFIQEAFQHEHIQMMAFGGVFIVIGLLVVGFALSAGEEGIQLGGILFGLVFAAAGAVPFGAGLLQVIGAGTGE